MRTDKDLIFQLRKEGRSYRDIQKITGVSRATLCDWFKKEDWSKHLTRQYSEKSVALSKERMIRMNIVRNLKLQYQYALVEDEAKKEYERYKKEPLFWAGLMLYAGEGDKKSKGQIRLSNSEFYIHRIFMDFEEKYLGIKREKVRCALLIYPDLSKEECLMAWERELFLGEKQFHKTHVIKRKETIKKLQFGVGITIISNTALKKKLSKWLQLAQKERFT